MLWGGTMFRGTVSYQASTRGSGIKFPAFDANPGEPGVDKVTFEGPDGLNITSTVHLSAVPSEHTGRTLAETVNETMLDRLAYHTGMILERARQTGESFSPMTPPAGGPLVVKYTTTVGMSTSAFLVKVIPTAPLQTALEDPVPPGERHFALFRSALQSASPVERFMHLYNLLLMLYSDSQKDLDAFIMSEEPGVPRTQHPKKPPGVMETVYTRLRNEFAHTRPGVLMAQTKKEMEARLGALVQHVRRAIEQNP